VRAPALAGIFYAVQTLRQLTPSEGEPALPAVAIRDEPRLQWRGLMMDVSRHFFNAAEVKRMLDTMSLFKFNHFHWHLTDDQGWRLPVKGYPKLTELGATGPDGKVRAYTEADIRDVVAYAAERHITVLPEVDVPGHSAAAIASYPELGNDDMPGFRPPHEPVSTWGMFHFTLGPSGNGSRFLRSVFNEVSDLFPGPFVHIGGDEAPTDQWDRSPRARKVLREQSLYHVQSHFNEELSTILKGRNKTVVAWDEAQHMPGLHPDAVVLAWRSIDELKRAVRGGRRCVNADVSTLYFDRYQGSQGKEPKANCCYTPLAQVYRYDPIPAGLHQDEERLVMGAQAQLWAEYDPTFKQVEYQAFPRALALAERLWTPREEVVSFEEFMGRLRPRVEADLGRRGVNYRRIQGDEER
jgi:hexosaminidase